MATTPYMNLPYPIITDTNQPDVDIENLLKAVETNGITNRFANVSARDSAWASPTEGLVTWVTSTISPNVYDGAKHIGTVFAAAYATIDRSFTSTTPAAHADLVVPLPLPNAVYEIRFGFFATNTSSGGCRTTWTLPASTTSKQFYWGLHTGGVNSHMNVQTTATTNVDTFAGGSGVREGVLRVTTGATTGTAQLNVGIVSAGTTIIRAGSHIAVRQVG